jgi:hypothetical protein
VPPAALTVDVPLLLPAQVTFEFVNEFVITAGSVITTFVVAIHPLPSVTVTE